jgi:phosphatidylethanolamine-binding protein (PEBP) family uncharacterized protein
MDDMDIRFIPEFNHWLIWNIPKMKEIPDCFLPLGSDARKRELLKAMEGHILQEGSITGKYMR